jgi:hypothetical protein
VTFELSYPWWFIGLCILVGLALSLGFYLKEQKFSVALKWLLATLRFLSGFTIAFLLLNPLLKWMSTETEKPLIAIVQDNSASQKSALSKINRPEYELELKGLITQLEKDFNVKKYTLGNTLQDSIPLTYSENGTNISDALEQVVQNNRHNNLGAVILTSDGIINAGNYPSTIKLATMASLYAVGIGDTTLRKDALISKTYANKIVYRGDKFNVKADAAGISCNGLVANVQIIHNNSGKVIYNQRIAFVGNRSSKQIEAIIDASSAGLQHYSVVISKVDGEQNTTNNKQDFYVDVLDNKEKILILANSPHPDINALQAALAQNKNTDVDIKLAANAASIIPNDYNLVILHNLPSMANNVQNLIASFKAQGAGMFYIIGAQTSLASFNSVQNATQISAASGNQIEINSSWNKSFTYFNYNAAEAEKLNTLPPLKSPIGAYKTGPNTQVLLFQKINGGIATNPLIALQQNGSQRIGVLTGEGIWRWRMFDFIQHKNQDAIDGLLKKVVQYLSVKQDKKKFRVNVNKSIFNKNETVFLDAELYNDNYELINTGEVTLQLTDDKNKKTTYNFNKQERNFNLSLQNLLPGDYSFEAKSNANGITRTEKNNFKIIDLDIENSNDIADFGTLNQLALNHNGKFVFAEQVGSLYDMIKKNDQIKSVVREEVHSEPIINWQWILGVLLALLSLEWFLRKYNGGL